MCCARSLSLLFFHWKKFFSATTRPPPGAEDGGFSTLRGGDSLPQRDTFCSGALIRRSEECVTSSTSPRSPSTRSSRCRTHSAPATARQDHLLDERRLGGSLRFGILNEGKLNSSKDVVIGDYLESINADLTFIPEGAHFRRTEVSTLTDYLNVGPLAQRSGGAAIALKDN